MTKLYVRKSVSAFAKNSAVKLNQQTEKLSPAKKKIGLLMFCFLFGSISVYIILDAFAARSLVSHSVMIQRGLIPSHIGKNNDDKPETFISVAEFLRL